jgi:hypothetical protein
VDFDNRGVEFEKLEPWPRARDPRQFPARLKCHPGVQANVVIGDQISQILFVQGRQPLQPPWPFHFTKQIQGTVLGIAFSQRTGFGDGKQISKQFIFRRMTGGGHSLIFIKTHEAKGFLINVTPLSVVVKGRNQDKKVTR